MTDQYLRTDFVDSLTFMDFVLYVFYYGELLLFFDVLQYAKLACQFRVHVKYCQLLRTFLTANFDIAYCFIRSHSTEYIISDTWSSCVYSGSFHNNEFIFKLTYIFVAIYSLK